ncbi:hypothetical protein [Streptomyces sp. NBC_01615]|uniref:hypothetical protein n=1 Tax=Streptomyces sp. NBC_01615 TaxID=2975898 RepID=UPI00386D134C
MPLLVLLLSRLLALLLPGTGRRRRGVRDLGPTEVSPWPRRPRPDPGAALALPRLRSPYAREAATDHRVDVTAAPLTRPYYRAAEKQRLQEERRLALVLALEGVDFGLAIIHGVTVGV